jgi:DNA-binding beta-propeller fold protein YncE
MMLLTFILCLAWTLSSTTAMAQAQSSPIPAADYTVARTWKLGGLGAFDDLALEESGGRLFIGRDERVDVVETVSGKMAGTIAHTAGVRGIAFAPALRRGYTSNSRANTVSVFELDTLRVIQEAPVSGKTPVSIYYEPQQNHIITGNRETANLTVLDASTLQIVATVALPGPPESMASDESGHLYVNINSVPGKVVLIDSKTLAVKAAWPLKECANPTGLAFDVAGHRLFSVCANQVMAITDSVSGKSIARVVVGRGPDGTAYDRDLGLVFTANGIDGTLTVIHQDSPDDYRVTATVTTQVSANILALDPATHKIYLAAARFDAPPAASAEQPSPHAPVIPDSFVILVAQPR